MKNTTNLFGQIRPSSWLYVGLILLACVGPFVGSRVMLMQLWPMVLFAAAFNLLAGFGGLLAFGHAAFFGIAAYTTGYLATAYGPSTEISILAGVMVSVVLGAAFGWLSIRRQGIYFSMITLALAQVVYFAIIRSEALGRDDGIQGIPRGKLFGLLDLRDDTVMYITAFVIMLGGLLLIHRIVRSPMGLAVESIRMNERRSMSLGYRVDSVKLLLFTLSAGLSGLAGSVRALSFQVVAPSDVHWSLSGVVILMVLVGGLGTLAGPVIGAVILLALEHYLQFLGSWFTVVLGVLYILCIHFFRQGIAGQFKLATQRRSMRIQARLAPCALRGKEST